MADKEKSDGFQWPFGPKNYLYFGAGMITIILGYITLAYTAPDPIPGDNSWPQLLLTISPALLVIGYCVLIPMSIIVRGQANEPSGAGAEADS